ncbi:MAG: four helix bundle protein [Thermoguttaceae bacterium]|jgi:four helix bundle protein|nr:four helix bundle protein [Thermoguttaceae bacterium]
MNSDQLRNRTKQFALRVIKLAAAMPHTRAGDVLGRQILRSGTSIGANYREALRASSRRHFTTTLEIAIREADETLYWLELLGESGIVKPSRLSDLSRECDELIAILTATVVSTKRQLKTANPKS